MNQILCIKCKQPAAFPRVVIEPFICVTCQHILSQDSKLDEVVKDLLWKLMQVTPHEKWEARIKSTLQSHIQELRRDKERMKHEHLCFVALIQGGLYGLSTHPTDVPLNGHLISKKSMKKLYSIYHQVLEERKRADSAVKEQV